MAVVALPYIDVDEKGVARVAGTRFKVKFLAIEHTAHGLSPAQIHEAHKSLSIAQIYAALTYYFAHQDEIDSQIASDQKQVDEREAAAGVSPFFERMKKEGRIADK